MISKPLNFILIYILSVINFVIILFPLTFFIVPLLFINNDHVQKSIISILLLSVFFVSGLMLVILFFDFLFGFSVRPFLRNCINYKKDKKYRVFFETFDEIKYRFGKPNTKLLIKKSSEVNAFAIGGLGRNNIVITEGLLLHYLTQVESKEEFIKSIEGVIGHEMSHLINKDYLPGLLLTINEQATQAFSRLVYIIFNIFIRLFSIIPTVGYLVAQLVIGIYKIFDFFIFFFHKYVILNVYKFILLQISKNIEYRCDKQSAQACGGDTMALALSFLGENGYFTIFSTHPKTKQRIGKVKNVRIKGRARASLASKLMNLFSLLCIFYLFVLSGARSDIPGLIRDYNNMADFVFRKLYYLKLNFQNFTGIYW